MIEPAVWTLERYRDELERCKRDGIANNMLHGRGCTLIRRHELEDGWTEPKPLVEIRDHHDD